jgi:Methyltransferase domain
VPLLKRKRGDLDAVHCHLRCKPLALQSRTCDPHRLIRIANERRRLANKGQSQSPGSPCLIYSVGSLGHFEWEDGMYRELGNRNDLCEIHIFDPKDYSKRSLRRKGMHFHAWGLRSSYSTNYNGTDTAKGTYLSLPETMERLGHVGRVIDIFKIDCEGCEWFVFRDLLGTSIKSRNVDIRQILVETHGLPPQSEVVSPLDYFDAFAQGGFALFSKEVNIYPGANNRCVEWSYVRLHPDFWRQQTMTNGP